MPVTQRPCRHPRGSEIFGCFQAQHRHDSVVCLSMKALPGIVQAVPTRAAGHSRRLKLSKSSPGGRTNPVRPADHRNHAGRALAYGLSAFQRLKTAGEPPIPIRSPIQQPLLATTAHSSTPHAVSANTIVSGQAGRVARLVPTCQPQGRQSSNSRRREACWAGGGVRPWRTALDARQPHRQAAM